MVQLLAYTSYNVKESGFYLVIQNSLTNIPTTFRGKLQREYSHESLLLSILTLGSSRSTLAGFNKLLLLIRFWVAVETLVLCSHREKSPVPLGPCGPGGPCDPLKPCGPIIPWGPCVPLNPRGPANPMGP